MVSTIILTIISGDTNETNQQRTNQPKNNNLY